MITFEPLKKFRGAVTVEDLATPILNRLSALIQQVLDAYWPQIRQLEKPPKITLDWCSYDCGNKIGLAISMKERE